MNSGRNQLTGFTLAVMLTAAMTHAAEDTAQLAKIILNANRDYESSVVSVQARFLRKTRDFGGRIRDEPEVELTWARSGKRVVLFSDPNFDYRGKRRPRLWCAWTGSEAINVFYYQFDPHRVSQVEYSQTFPDLIDEWAAPPMALGWTLRFSHADSVQGETLVSLIKKARHETITREPARLQVDKDEFIEFPAVKWPLLEYQNASGQMCTLTAWFDEQEMWLPRMWLVQVSENVTGRPAGQQVLLTFGAGVRSFTEIQDSLLKKPRRFPQETLFYTFISNSLASITTSSISSVEINSTIPDSMFKPVLTEGAEVIHNAGTRRQVRNFVGGEDGENAAAEVRNQERLFRHPELAEAATSEPIATVSTTAATPLSTGTVNAKPETGSYLTMVILCASCVAIVAAIWLRFRQTA